MASTSRLATFSPNEVTVIITQQSSGMSHIVGGFAEDSIVSVERNSETFSLYTGADDSNTRVYNANTSGTITISLQQTSASNDILSALYENDRARRSGLFSITVKDNSGRSNYFSEEAYIAVVPSAGHTNSMQTREWVVHAPKLVAIIGGNGPISAEDAASLDQLGISVDSRWL